MHFFLNLELNRANMGLLFGQIPITMSNDYLLIQTEEDLLQEKLKIKKVSDELDQTFDDMLSLSV